MGLIKTITGRIITGLVVLGVVIGAISWREIDPVSQQAAISSAGRVAAWLAVVLILPWASYLLIDRVVRMESNAAAGLLVAGFTIPEIVLLAWLFNWPFESYMGWTCVLVGGLFAALYNIFTCDWIAEKIET